MFSKHSVLILSSFFRNIAGNCDEDLDRVLADKDSIVANEGGAKDDLEEDDIIWTMVEEELQDDS